MSHPGVSFLYLPAFAPRRITEESRIPETALPNYPPDFFLTEDHRVACYEVRRRTFNVANDLWQETDGRLGVVVSTQWRQPPRCLRVTMRKSDEPRAHAMSIRDLRSRLGADFPETPSVEETARLLRNIRYRIGMLPTYFFQNHSPSVAAAAIRELGGRPTPEVFALEVYPGKALFSTELAMSISEAWVANPRRRRTRQHA